MGSIPISIDELVGNTPVVEMTALLGAGSEAGARLFAKLEAFNPGGSVKDRIGVAMIEAAERDGLIGPGETTIVEATSGNTGIALAFVCAAKGYDLQVFLPQGMSREREALLRMYGAKVEVVESMGGMSEAVNAAKAMALDGGAFLPDQFSNPANPEAHRLGTGPELLGALDNKIDIFVAGVGTGGTITGAGEAIKAVNPKAKVVAVEPQTSAVLSGGPAGVHRIQGIGAGFVPAVLNRELIDEVIAVPDEVAIATARAAASQCGVLAGLSCGAALAGAIEVAARPESKGARIAVVLPDSGERYISAPYFAPAA
jgi:cysteine synthase A